MLRSKELSNICQPSRKCWVEITNVCEMCNSYFILRDLNNYVTPVAKDFRKITHYLRRCTATTFLLGFAFGELGS